MRCWFFRCLDMLEVVAVVFVQHYRSASSGSVGSFVANDVIVVVET